MVVKKNHLKIIAFFLLVILLGYMTVTAISNIIDYKIDAFNINPTEKIQKKVIHLNYPNTNPMVGLIESEGNLIDTPLITLYICLNYTGTLVEGKKVGVSAIGFVFPVGRTIISGTNVYPEGEQIWSNYTAIIGFEGASLYDDLNPIYESPDGQVPIYLHEWNNYSIMPRLNREGASSLPVYQNIKWDLQGDYYPYVILVLKNNSSATIPFEDFKVHVGDSDIIRQQENSRIITSLTVVLFGLTFMATINFLFDLLPDEINFNFLRRKK